jgi:hypothetical protein
VHGRAFNAFAVKTLTHTKNKLGLMGKMLSKESKTMRSLISLCMLLIVSSYGCIPHRIAYDISLGQVERPAEAKERYGNQEIYTIEGDGGKYYFEDKMIRIGWAVTAKDIAFVLENKTDYSIRIIWDEAAYVDMNGFSHRVMHSGVKYIDRANTQAPTVVVRRGSVSDIVVPTDYILNLGEYGWKEGDILPNSSRDPDNKRLINKAKEYLGKKIQVLLPLQIQDTVIDYIFVFTIESVKEINSRSGDMRIVASIDSATDEARFASINQSNELEAYSSEDYDEDIVNSLLSESDEMVLLPIIRVRGTYAIIYQEKDIIMAIDSVYRVLRFTSSSDEPVQIGDATVVKIKGSSVALRVNLMPQFGNVTTEDKIEYTVPGT